MSIPLIATLVTSNLLRSILVASLETKPLPRIMIISSISRAILTLILVLLGTGAIGIVVGYLSAYVSTFLLLSLNLVAVLKPVKRKPRLNLYHACKNIFIASTPTWISQIIGIIGANLGTLVIFGSIGASQAGSYFIALTIFYAIGSIRGSIFGIAFPVLSAMDDHRKKLVWKLIRLSLILSLPISFTVILYSDEVIAIIGVSYLDGSVPLKILLLSIFTGTFNLGMGTLLYSYGHYRKVVAVGLGSDVSRILFYFVLVPMYGNVGAALAFTVGSILGFVVSLIVAKNIGMKIFWKDLALLFIIPAGLAFVIDLVELHYIIGVPLLLALSILIYLRLRVLSKSDMDDYFEMIPDKIAEPLIKILKKLY